MQHTRIYRAWFPSVVTAFRGKVVEREKTIVKIAKAIVASLPCDPPKNDIIINSSLCVTHVLEWFYHKDHLFKYKRFKDGRCRHKIIVSSLLNSVARK